METIREYNRHSYPCVVVQPLYCNADFKVLFYLFKTGFPVQPCVTMRRGTFPLIRQCPLAKMCLLLITESRKKEKYSKITFLEPKMIP